MNKACNKAHKVILFSWLSLFAGLLGGCNDASTSLSDDFTVAVMTTDTIDELLFTPMIQNGNLSSDQITCLENRNTQLIQDKTQAYFNEKFSSEELDTLNSFYGSALGKKMIAYNNEQILISNGMVIETPLPEPSADEFAQMQAFMQTPEAQKFKRINDAQGKDSLAHIINPLVIAQLERCDIKEVI